MSSNYPHSKEKGFVCAQYCAALDGGWVVVYDRRKGGPVELAAAPEAKTKRYVLLYRAEAEEVRAWAQPGRWVGLASIGEARKRLVAICAGDDPAGVLPVADCTALGGLNQRQFLFAQLHMTRTMSDADAYVKAGYKSKSPAQEASALLATQKVQDYLAQARGVTLKKFTMTKLDILGYCQQVMMTPVGEVDASHFLCQESVETEDSTKLKMPGKLDAAKIIVDVMGWNEKDANDKKVADALPKLLERIGGWTVAPKPSAS